MMKWIVNRIVLAVLVGCFMVGSVKPISRRRGVRPKKVQYPLFSPLPTRVTEVRLPLRGRRGSRKVADPIDDWLDGYQNRTSNSRNEEIKFDLTDLEKMKLAQVGGFTFDDEDEPVSRQESTPSKNPSSFMVSKKEIAKPEEPMEQLEQKKYTVKEPVSKHPGKKEYDDPLDLLANSREKNAVPEMPRKRADHQASLKKKMNDWEDPLDSFIAEYSSSHDQEDENELLMVRSEFAKEKMARSMKMSPAYSYHELFDDENTNLKVAKRDPLDDRFMGRFEHENRSEKPEKYELKRYEKEKELERAQEIEAEDTAAQMADNLVHLQLQVPSFNESFMVASLSPHPMPRLVQTPATTTDATGHTALPVLETNNVSTTALGPLGTQMVLNLLERELEILKSLLAQQAGYNIEKLVKTRNGIISNSPSLVIAAYRKIVDDAANSAKQSETKIRTISRHDGILLKTVPLPPTRSRREFLQAMRKNIELRAQAIKKMQLS